MDYKINNKVIRLPQYSQLTRTEKHNLKGSSISSPQDNRLSSSYFPSVHGLGRSSQGDESVRHSAAEGRLSEKNIPPPGFSFASMCIHPDPSQLKDSADPKWMPSASSPTIWPVQAKLAINRPGDRYEQEADSVAEQVMRKPEPRIVNRSEMEQPPHIQRSCPKCKKKVSELRQDEKDRLHMKPVSGASSTRSAAQAMPSPILPIVHEVLLSPGKPLDPAMRAFMEPRFGHDFSNVRVHTDARAAESARALNASAFTVANDLAFNTDRYSPGTAQGRRLLAHELTHVLQQSVAERDKIGSNPELSPENQADALGIQSEISEYFHIDSLIPVRAGTIQREELGSRVTHPAGSQSAYRSVTATFIDGVFSVNGDRTEIMRCEAQSGRPYTVRAADVRSCGGSPGDSYLNNPRYVGISDNGPIPEGVYQFRATEMTTFSFLERYQMMLGGSYTDPFGRSLHGGDWGSGRVALRKISVLPGPRGCGNTATRLGFYLHGGIMPGSSGCIDIGNDGFDRLVSLLAGYRHPVRVTVRYTQPAPAVGAVDRALGRFTYPPGENPGVLDRLRALFGGEEE